MHGRHVDGQHARRLGGIQYEFQAVGMAESPNLRRRQHRAADVAGMQHHNSPRVIPQQSRHGRRIQRTVPSARDTVKGHAPALQLGQRPHDGVVLYGGHQHMVSGAQKALQQHVQALRNIAGKCHVPAVRAVEQRCQPLPGLQHQLLRLIRLVIAAAVDVAAALLYILIDRLRYAFRLGKAGAGVVQIDPLHGFMLLFPYFLLVYHTFIEKSNLLRGYIYN